MRIKSEVDWWFNILIWLTVGIIAASMLIIPKNEQVVGYAVGFPIIFFIFWIYFGTYYKFGENYLLCKSGPFFEKIHYEKIKSVKLCQNMFSSMALSKKRIEIRQHCKGYIMGTTFISPKNREEFLQELASRCKNLI